MSLVLVDFRTQSRRTGDGKSSARGRAAYPHMHNVKLVQSRCGIKAPTSLTEQAKARN